MSVFANPITYMLDSSTIRFTIGEKQVGFWHHKCHVPDVQGWLF